MTVNTTPVETNYTGNASATVFALTFAFAANAHVKVYLGGVLQGSGYSITGAGNPSGGTLTFSAAPGSGVAIKARRVTPLTQEIDVVNNATVFASSLETGLDYALMRQQEEAFDRVQLGITFAIDAAAVDADAAAAAASAASALASENAAEADRVATAADRVQTGLDRVQTGADVATAASILASRQPLDADLTAIAALTSAADRVPYATGAGTWALATLTSFARTLLATANNSAFLAALGQIASSALDFINAGAGAVTRTVQAKLRDIVNVRDFGATGDGTTDDAAAIRAAIAAASGRTLYFPTPASSYLCNSSLGTLSSVRLLGDGRRVCTIKKNYSGGSPFITMNDSSEIEGLRIDLSGNTGITGLGVYIANGQGNQRIAATQLLNGDTSCLYFQKDGGSNFTAYDLQAYCFTASNPAVEIEDVSTSGCPRSFVNFSSGGNKSFKLGGANNLFVSNSPIFDVDFSANNYDVCFANCRMAGSSGYTVRGSGSIMGGGIGPAMTIASGAAWNINPAYTNSTITDNSGGTSIIHQHNIVSYTPVWTAGGAAVTLGTGGSIVGRYSRSGKLVTAKFRILPGTGPTIPAGKWEITLPVPTAADLPQAVGTGKYTTGGGAFYRINGYVPATGTAVTLERDTSGEITGTSPSATGNGAGVWFQITYET